MELNKRNKNYPNGKLRISHSNGCVQYYMKEKQVAHSGEYKLKYIKKENMEMVQQLAQKEYDTMLLKELTKRLKSLKKARSVYVNTDPVRIYDKCIAERKNLINPSYISSEEYVKRWEQVTYEKKAFAEGTVEIYTAKKERVRSKSEKIIADTLERRRIPYRYECPLELKGKRIIHPDFTVLNKRTRKEYYWEHMGMMDDNEYVTNAIKRVESLIQNGVFPGKNLIITVETKALPINIGLIDTLIQEYLI